MTGPAYIIFEADVTDPEGYEEYRGLAGAAVEQYGARYVVRGGRSQVLEGQWRPGRMVIVEYESFEKALAFYESPEYRRAREARATTARVNMVVVEGLPSQPGE